MTVINFMSESSDHYIETTNVNNIEDLNRFFLNLTTEYGEEFEYLNIESIKSDIFSKDEIYESFEKTKNNLQ